MKTKRIPNLPIGKLATCSFCKKPNCTDKQVVGIIRGISGYYGGNSICSACKKKIEKIEQNTPYESELEISEGEAQLYHNYGIF